MITVIFTLSKPREIKKVKKRLALITGAAGFIGSNLARDLLTNGWKVAGIDNLSHGFLRNIAPLRHNADFSFIKGDCRDRKLLRPLLRKADTVIHLAAYKIPRYGGRREMMEVNLDAMRTIAEESAAVGSGHIVLASTSDIYGKNPALPFHESSNSILGPSQVARWAYAVSKICDEHLLWGYHEEKRLEPVVLRFFGCYGPNENRTWWGGPQAVFIERTLKRQTLEIHGDGQQTRTFCYIDDLVHGIRLATESSGAIGHAWNLGGDEEISIADLAKRIWKMAAPKARIKMKLIPYTHFAGNYEDVRRRVPDLSASAEAFSYKPAVSLEEGLGRTIEWHRRFIRK